MDRQTPGRLRRAMLVALTSAGLMLSACAGGATLSPTAAAKTETRPTEAAKPAAGASPATNPAAKPAAGASPVAAAPAAGAPTLVTGPFQGEARALNGAGATFPAPIYTRWFNDYEKLTGVKVNYQAIGSGGGIRAISDQTADFGATDGPMTDEQLRAAKGGEVLHIPTVLGAVVPIYNVSEVGLQTLRFSGETLAGIYLGDIKKWDDPAIKADNPNAILPSRDIVVIHRSEGSGTTFIWTDYLASVSPKWKSGPGTATTVSWPTGLGAQGNPGVTNEVRQNPYAIGYVELIYAIQNRLPAGHVKNRAGQYVEPTTQSVTAAAAGADIPADLRASIVNSPGPTAYPISGFTWLLAYQNMPDRSKAIALTRLMHWVVTEGQKLAPELGYAPLPAEVQQKAVEKILSIKTSNEQAFPGR